MTSNQHGDSIPEVSGLPVAGTVIEERYQLRERVGKGGMGVVMKATDLRVNRSVAIKLVHSHLARNQEFIQRFEREVEIAKELNHQNTIRLYDFGVTEDVMYLVMEYLEGQELQELIDEGPMALDRVLRLSLQLLDGLAEAHAIDVVHRDLKPGNIFICEDRRGREQVKVLDFGIAKTLGDAHQQITRTGQVVGTAPYLPPELYLSSEVTKACDVYSCGLIMLEMLCSRRVIDTASMVTAMSQHIHLPIIMPKSLQQHPITPVIKQATAKDPAERYPDAEAMLQQLQQVDVGSKTAPLGADEINTAFDQMLSAYQNNTQNMLSPAGSSPSIPRSNAPTADHSSTGSPYTGSPKTAPGSVDTASPGPDSPNSAPADDELQSTMLLNETEIVDLDDPPSKALPMADTAADFAPPTPDTDTAAQELDKFSVQPGDFPTSVGRWPSFLSSSTGIAGTMVVAALVVVGAMAWLVIVDSDPPDDSVSEESTASPANRLDPSNHPEGAERAMDSPSDGEQEFDSTEGPSRAAEHDEMGRTEPETDSEEEDAPQQAREVSAAEEDLPERPDPEPTSPPPSTQPEREPEPSPPARGTSSPGPTAPDDSDDDDDADDDPFDSVLDRHL